MERIVYWLVRWPWIAAAALFVGLGATIEDMSSTSNFQGLIMMLPFSPLLLIGPILSDPSGLVAQIGTFIPFTSPAVLIVRLSLLEEWPWVEIGIAIALLAVVVWLVMKLAGKIFRIGHMGDQTLTHLESLLQALEDVFA